MRPIWWIVIILLAFVVGTAIITALVVDKIYYDATKSDVKYEQEYYRGVYDACFQRVLNPEYCERITRQALKNGWFVGPSPGFEWLDIKGGSLESGYLR